MFKIPYTHQIPTKQEISRATTSMAISTPPPPCQHPPPSPTPSAPPTNPPITRPLFPIPSPSHPQQLSPKPPLTSTPRFHYPNQPNPLIPNSNLKIYSSRPNNFYQNPPHPAPPFTYANPPRMDPVSGQFGPGLGFMGPPNHLQRIITSPSSAGGVGGGVIKGLPIFKMGSNHTPIVDNHGFTETRDKTRDERLMIVRDRKVRVSETSSLYALCRSWLRNGLPEETEPQYNDVVKSLPRPLPLAPEDSDSQGKKEEQEEDEEEQDGGFVEHLSPHDLLQKHIKRAKRVRSRLRVERRRRIDRFKTRLSLLLPPIVEQHYRNESTARNGNIS